MVDWSRTYECTAIKIRVLCCVVTEVEKVTVQTVAIAVIEVAKQAVLGRTVTYHTNVSKALAYQIVSSSFGSRQRQLSLL